MINKYSSLRFLIAAILTIGIGVHACAYADQWPSKAIRLIVPFPPGGSTDVAARLFADQLTKRLGQTVIVENMGGANGTIGLSNLARAKPDGYTLAVASNGNMVINQFLYSKLPFDPNKDFTPIGVLSEYTNIVVVKENSPFKTLADLLAYGKAHPGKMNYGSAGIGSSNHLGGYTLMREAGIQAIHVPYRGSNPSLVALMAGELDFMFDNKATSMSHYRAGKIRILATAGKSRLWDLPDIPSISETIPNYESKGWFGLFGPAGLPETITQRLSQEVTHIISDKDFVHKLSLSGLDVKKSTPEVLRAMMTDEAAALAPVMKNSGIKLD